MPAEIGDGIADDLREGEFDGNVDEQQGDAGGNATGVATEKSESGKEAAETFFAVVLLHCAFAANSPQRVRKLLQFETLELLAPKIDGVRRGFERIEKIERIDTFSVDDFPIDEIAKRLVFEHLHDVGADLGASVGGRFARGFLNFGGGDVPGFRGFGEGQAEAAGRVDVVKFKILSAEPGIDPGDFFVFDKLAEEPPLGDPIDLADERVRVLGEGGERFIPDLEDDVGLGVASFKFVGGGFAIFVEQFDRAGAATVSESGEPGTVRLMRHAAEGHDGVGEDDLGHVIEFEEIQDERSGADLQEESGGKYAGVAMEEVKAAVFACICERFIAGVDDGAVELHPLEEVVVDVIGALADLEMTVGAMTEEIAAKFGAGSSADASRADE